MGFNQGLLSSGSSRDFHRASALTVYLFEVIEPLHPRDIKRSFILNSSFYFSNLWVYNTRDETYIHTKILLQ